MTEAHRLLEEAVRGFVRPLEQLQRATDCEVVGPAYPDNHNEQILFEVEVEKINQDLREILRHRLEVWRDKGDFPTEKENSQENSQENPQENQPGGD